MNAATAVIALIVVFCLAYAVYNIIKTRKNGGCGSCPTFNCNQCELKNNCKKK